MATSKFGIFDFGFINNSGTFVNELNSILEGTSQYAEFDKFNKHFYSHVTLNKNIIYLNKYGYQKDRGDNLIEKDDANYAYYETGFVDKEGEKIYGFFQRKTLNRNFEGIYFLNLNGVQNLVKENLLFNIGLICFDNPETSWEDGFDFIEELATTAIPEKWTYGTHSSTIPHPILKSYLEYIFIRLTKEDGGKKILIDDNKNYALFNSGLLNIYFKPIYIVVQIKKGSNGIYYANPIILKKRTTLAEISFTINGNPISNKIMPEPAQFYNSVNEIVFKPEPEFYDPDDEKLRHIVQERKNRFPDNYQERSTTELAVILDTAIKCSYELSKRNYKLVVPQYRPQEDKIQYLMPIYLGATFNKLPDFALVLDHDSGYYKPETILELEDAYQNARLIAKPDNFWLNPEQK
ncbi:DUF3825 domain-containing protein [Maribacter chungangensis]|uniref:DUF3825 domain-containing protein n=1 Tax=Maribacter chungangensis TaxID=1069117 RepID=A0ABW3B0Y0_9FLAO